MELAAAMYDRGLLMTREPMEPLSDGSSSSDDDAFEVACDDNVQKEL